MFLIWEDLETISETGFTNTFAGYQNSETHYLMQTH